MRRRRTCFLLTLALCAAAALFPTAALPAPPTLGQLRQVERNATAAIDRVAPAVVAIQTPEGWGSGVVVSAEGLVLTAGHVSGEPGRRCRVVFPSGRELRGRSLGRHLGNDAGMIELAAEGAHAFPYATLGPTGAPPLGAWVVSLGHPGGFEDDRPVTARLGRIADRRPGTLQSDCTLVGGDSGGPLIDLQGRVRGVHSRIGGRVGLNYHVPTAAFVRHWPDLQEGRQLRAGFLGVSRVDLSNEPVVADVQPGGPADVAGVLPGDRVTAFEGAAIDSFTGLGDAVSNRAAGETVTLTVRRGSRTLDLRVELGVRPEADQPNPPKSQPEALP